MGMRDDGGADGGGDICYNIVAVGFGGYGFIQNRKTQHTLTLTLTVSQSHSLSLSVISLSYLWRVRAVDFSSDPLQRMDR